MIFAVNGGRGGHNSLQYCIRLSLSQRWESDRRFYLQPSEKYWSCW